MRSTFVAAAAACLSLAACGGWKSGQANSAQGNISQDSRPPATAKASTVTNNSVANGMAMVAVPSVKGAQAMRIMHERHEGMEAIGRSLKALNRALPTSDLGTIRANAAKVAQLARSSSGWFPAGTGPDVEKTGAKAEIWQNPQDFAAKLHNFQVAAQAFNAAAASGNASLITEKFHDLGGTCKACHDKYRAEEKH